MPKSQPKYTTQKKVNQIRREGEAHSHTHMFICDMLVAHTNEINKNYRERARERAISAYVIHLVHNLIYHYYYHLDACFDRRCRCRRRRRLVLTYMRAGRWSCPQSHTHWTRTIRSIDMNYKTCEWDKWTNESREYDKKKERKKLRRTRDINDERRVTIITTSTVYVVVIVGDRRRRRRCRLFVLRIYIIHFHAYWLNSEKKAAYIISIFNKSFCTSHIETVRSLSLCIFVFIRFLFATFCFESEIYSSQIECGFMIEFSLIRQLFDTHISSWKMIAFAPACVCSRRDAFFYWWSNTHRRRVYCVVSSGNERDNVEMCKMLIYCYWNKIISNCALRDSLLHCNSIYLYYSCIASSNCYVHRAHFSSLVLTFR